MGAALLWENVACRTPSSSSRRVETRPGVAWRSSRSTTARITRSRPFFGRAALESLERAARRARGAATGPRSSSPASRSSSRPAPTSTSSRTCARASCAIEGSRAGHELFGRIRALPFPTVAAINGACLGGGVELALHCDARTISTAVRHFACPECFLGIIPAWGGTQLVPRLVGAETAVKFIVANPMRQNRMLTARRRSSSASPTGCSSRRSSWTSRSRSRSSSPSTVPSSREADVPERAPKRSRGRAAARRHGPRRRARAVPRARPDRGRAHRLDARGGLPRRGGGGRRAAARPAGTGLPLRVRPRRRRAPKRAPGRPTPSRAGSARSASSAPA